ncbi:MAG: fibrobacter succinogenes major paralogous domain-containing protein [Bacteroidetes bacterium]|nr:fibrobacter succinogenes major paralogous domain-containing protein [Bacteroidota bacterium]
MKKSILTIAVSLTIGFGAYAQKTTDEGVVINGVKWATCNVDKPGTFAATPESGGYYYQWNRKKGYDDTTTTFPSWDYSIPQGTTWEKANDPSPKGWRVPTQAEIHSLCDETKVKNEWVIQNGVGGRKFTDKATGASIFLPAVGKRYASLNRNIKVGTGYQSIPYNSFGELAKGGGAYWSSTACRKRDAYFLNFADKFYGKKTGIQEYYNTRIDGLSIRPVKE